MEAYERAPKEGKQEGSKVKGDSYAKVKNL